MKDEKPHIHIEVSNLLTQQRKAAPLAIKIALVEALEVFRENPLHDSLRNHALAAVGKTYVGLWSIDVTADWRAIYRREGNRIIFIALGTHAYLYG